MEINVDWARKNEGWYYGEGTANLCLKVAEAAAGKTKAAEQSAAVYKAVRKVCEEHGLNPDIEVHYWKPGENSQSPDAFRVSWESGPYDWAIMASDALGQAHVFAEPYYGFDLCFYPCEDAD